MGHAVSRFYDIGGRQLPSVTTITGCLAKPALDNWLVGLAMDAVEFTGDRSEARALFDQRRWEKANLGTAVHEAVAAEMAADRAHETVVHAPPVAPFLDQWRAFNEAHKVGPVMVETVVASRHGYAGRLDAILDVDGRRLLVDIKTGRLYRSIALQLAAYRYADIAYPDYPDCVIPAPLPKVEGCAILSLKARSWKLIEVEAGERQLTDFRYLAEAFRIGQQYDQPLD